jgi:hypothetical protein
VSARCGKCGAPVEDPARCSNGHAQPLDTPARLAALIGENIDLDLLADKVAERLRGFVPDLVAQVPADPETLVSARELARLTGMSTRWVYDHKQELGAIPAGNGARPRLRFDPGLARARLAGREEEGVKPARWEPPPRSSSVPLLPVRDRAA